MLVKNLFEKHPWDKAVISLGGIFHGQLIHDERIFYVGVDRGVDHLLRFNIFPHMIIGDLDSIYYEHLMRLLSESTAYFLISNWDKDYTDGQRAVEIVKQLGIKNVVLIGIWGSEIDHFMGNLSLFSMYFGHFEMMIGYTGIQILELVEGKIVRKLKLGTPVSFVPYDDVVELTLKGLYWEVNRRKFFRDDIPPISNITVSDTILVESVGKVWMIIGRENNPYLLEYLMKE